MNRRFEIRSLAVGVLIGIGLTVSLAAGKPKPVGYEYSVRRQMTEPLRDQELNKLDDQGWELVTSFQASDSQSLIFRRRK
jgi:hypothetical protein